MSLTLPWARAFQRSVRTLARNQLRASKRGTALVLKAGSEQRRPPAGQGDWIAGLALGAGGARRYRLYRPPGTQPQERLPLVVMLHGCGQDAKTFAQSTRMNRIAARERFLVLYPEQDRLANPQRCWNWFDSRGGRANGEAELVMTAVEQACQLYCVDRSRVAIVGLSAGASLAALLVMRHPARFQALVMHSGVPPGSADSTLSALAAMRGRRRAARSLAAPAAVVQTLPPLLVIHGGQDRTVAASNGHAAIREWAAAAGATAQALRTVQRGKRHPMCVTDFKAAGRLVATLVEVPQLGHAWSGGSASQPYGDALGPDASRIAWAFAAKQFQSS